MRLFQLIDFLKMRPALNIIILLVYYLVVVLPHEQVGVFISDIFSSMSRSAYDLTMLVIFSMVLIILLFSFLKRLLLKENNYLFYFLTLSLIMIAFCYQFLFVVNVEAIHFVQYAFFAILLFPLIQNYRDTLGLSCLAGAFDEAYQYFYLAPNRSDYYDFNDVIINLVGASLALIAIKSYGVKSKKYSWYKSPFLIAVFILLSVVLIFVVSNLLSIYPVNEIPYSLIKNTDIGFWNVVHPSIIFHVVKPVEGVIILVSIIMIYGLLDRIEAGANN